MTNPHAEAAATWLGQYIDGQVADAVADRDATIVDLRARLEDCDTPQPDPDPDSEPQPEPDPEPGPTPTPTPSPVAYPRFGSSIGKAQGSPEWRATFDKINSLYGGMTVVRTFRPGNIGDWTKGDLGHILATTSPEVAICDSFKTYDLDAVRVYAQTKPDDGRLVYLCHYHEPENDTAAEGHGVDDKAWAKVYRERQRAVADVLADVGRDDIRFVGILMGWTITPASGRSLNDWHPGHRADGSHYWDEVWWDPYNAAYPGGYSDARDYVRRCKAASDDMGIPFGIAEFGTQLVRNDNGSGRAGWITDFSQACVDFGATGVCYWNAQLGASGGDYRIDDDPVASAAFRRFVAASRTAHTNR